jgi:hypothetical protein
MVTPSIFGCLTALRGQVAWGWLGADWGDVHMKTLRIWTVEDKIYTAVAVLIFLGSVIAHLKEEPESGPPITCMPGELARCL